jgi:hypothetical protein
MLLTNAATPGKVASSKAVGEKRGSMSIHHQAGPQPNFPIADQQSRERDEEARKIRRLQLMISMVISVISQDPNLWKKPPNWPPAPNAPPSPCSPTKN